MKRHAFHSDDKIVRGLQIGIGEAVSRGYGERAMWSAVLMSAWMDSFYDTYLETDDDKNTAVSLFERAAWRPWLQYICDAADVPISWVLKHYKEKKYPIRCLEIIEVRE